jgi:hypothetical protein
MRDLENIDRAEGVLLDRAACNILLRWWDWWDSIPNERKKSLTPRRRGRPAPMPIVDYAEWEQERCRIVAETGKERGSITRATNAMAKRWNTTDGAARKRIAAARKMLGRQKT